MKQVEQEQPAKLVVTVNDFFVSAEGVIIDYLDDNTGETLRSVAIPPGRVSARPYVEMCPKGASIDGSFDLWSPASAVFVSDAGVDRYLTDANPDYQPSSADLEARKMALTIAKMQAEQQGIMKQMRALARIETIPQAPKAEKPKGDEPEPELVE